MESVQLVHEAEGRFFDITWEGVHVEIAEGMAGTEGDVVQRTFVSVAEAGEFIRDLIAERRAQGFHEGTLFAEPAPDEDSAEVQTLVAHITENPDDETRYLVLADALQQRGHPRGQLIVLQHALAHDPSDEGRAHVEALLNAHPAQIYGDLADCPDIVDVELRLGFADRARLFTRHPEVEDLDAQAVTTGFLSHPTCRLLRHLVLALPDAMPSTALVEGAAAAEPMPTVRSLQLNAPPSYGAFVHVTAALARAFPGLTELAIFGGTITFGTAKWTELETLRLWGDLEHATTALERCSFPALKKIAIGGDCYGDAAGNHHVRLCEALVSSPLCAKLEVLELSLENAAGEILGAWIESHAMRFERIRSIVLAGDMVRVASVARALTTTGVRVTISPQVFAAAYTLHDPEQPDEEDEDEEEAGNDEREDDQPESEPEPDADGDETEHDEPGVDEDWEAPKDAPFEEDEPDEGV